MYTSPLTLHDLFLDKRDPLTTTQSLTTEGTTQGNIY